MLVAGAAGLLSALPAQAQAVSAAAEAAKAPPLPALDSVLTLPRFAMLDGSVFEPSGSSGKPLLVYWWSSTCTFCALWKYFPIQV
ncbi:MAG: hypothetical protein U5L74_07535 [Ideonella sp.]|nr:hypothetical protein [Ideonella sp.]